MTKFRLFHWTDRGLFESTIECTLPELGYFLEQLGGLVTWERESTLRKLGLA